MPVYNGEEYLGTSLDSLLRQTYTDFELIISDNGSEDDTERICREYARRDSRIRYIRREMNLGAAANFNAVFGLSKGELFKWAAADDLCEPTYLEQCVRRLRENPHAILAYPRTTIINQWGARVRDYQDGLALDSADPVLRFVRYLRRVGECNAVFGVIRREVLGRTALIQNFAGSDLLLLAELSLHGQFAEISDRLFLRREHPKASSWDKSAENQQLFFDPRTLGRPALRRWRHLKGHLGAIRRSPLRPFEKARAGKIALRRAVMVRDQLFLELRDAARTLTANGMARLNQRLSWPSPRRAARRRHTPLVSGRRDMGRRRADR
jgi:glycosyltransferase involved in cell wall biosynthesis